MGGQGLTARKERRRIWQPYLALVALLVALLLPKPLEAAPCIYTVRAGDTLGVLAARNGTTVGGILAANPEIENPNLIRVGQRLLLPNCEAQASIAADVAPVPLPPVRELPPPPADLPTTLWQRAHDASTNIRHPVDLPYYSGSAISIGGDGRTFLTAYHVVGDPETGEAATEVAIGPFGNWHYTAQVIAADPTIDLAILRVTDPEFPGFATVPVGSATALEPNDEIYTLSYPGYGMSLVSGKGHLLMVLQTFVNRSPLLVTDAAADFGSSGGVAVNERGEVIGIITGGIVGEEAMASIGYPDLDQATLIVPVDAAADLLAQVGIR